MMIVFKFQPKNTQIKYFGHHQNEGFFFLHQTLQEDNFEGTQFKYDNSFSNLPPKTPNKGFLVPDLRVFLFA